MGLLTSLIKQFTGNKTSLQYSLITEVLTWIEEQGGIAEILRQMKSSGLENIVQSWMSDQKNLPVSAQQILSFIAAPALQKLADSCGIDTGAAAEMLANYLPTLVNGLSQSGELSASASSDLLKAGLSVFDLKSSV